MHLAVTPPTMDPTVYRSTALLNLSRRRVFARSVGFESTKIVLMSATPNVKLLCDYFSVPEKSVVDVSRGIRKHELVIYFGERGTSSPRSTPTALDLRRHLAASPPRKLSTHQSPTH
jgi:hypothetical protein